MTHAHGHEAHGHPDRAPDRHDETHAHGEHGHTHASENYSARTHPEFVVLDIGDGVGALIVHTDPAMHGVEIEISPSGDDRRRSHKDVLERSINGRPAFTAVFDNLAAGDYTLWVAGEARARGVAIPGGAIVQLDWTSAPSESDGAPADTGPEPAVGAPTLVEATISGG